jgi:hypothetical protein
MFDRECLAANAWPQNHGRESMAAEAWPYECLTLSMPACKCLASVNALPRLAVRDCLTATAWS